MARPRQRKRTLIDDVELVRRIQRGDAAAADAFVRRHSDRLSRLARLWSRDEEDARDAVQEALLRGLSGIAAFRFRSAPLTWIVGTLRNVCAEQRRRSGRNGGTVDVDVDALAADDTTTGTAPHADARGALHRWLRELPPRQRDAVVLRSLEELSVKDTARIMDCREGTVKALLHQGMTRLRGLAERDGHVLPLTSEETT